MRGVKGTVRRWVLVVAAVAAACGPIDDSGIASDVERELERGRSYATALIAQVEDAPGAQDAIAAGYLERLRLGLGSPFRLIEHSLQDPRLDRELRERLAWALLARTLDGESYRVDPRAFGERDPDLAGRHMALIEGAIHGSADPDGGMLAVRLAYAMAAAESSVSESFQKRASQVASLVRDHALSQKDASRLLRAAGDATDPLALLTVWRVERKFDVERPGLLAPSAAVERDAVARAPRLLESIREIRHRPRAGPLVSRTEPSRRAQLPAEAARALAAGAALYDAPPQTPVAVSIRTYGRRLTDPDPATARFFENAVNEERLAAEYALLSAERADPGMAPRLALLSAAVGLRAYGQERPWFPGFGGPTSRDLEDRHGLVSVVFPEDVPAHWRPYYRRLLEIALTDLRRVLPSLDLRGMKVEFAPREGSPGTLAVHDPRTRTVYIPAATGAGTIAHEIAHDIDWQMALRRYKVRGDYGTDRAVRLADEQVARVLRGLTTASLADLPTTSAGHATRPAEVFARSVDWFVAMALAREGRVNGYLSSVQDDVLTGYGTVTAPDVTGTAGEALVTLLDEVAPVYPETRRWFLGSYGRLRAPTAYDLARRLVEAPLEPAGEQAEAAEKLADEGLPDEGLPDQRLPGDPLPGDTLAQDPGSYLQAQPRPARLSLALARLDRLEVARDDVLALVDSGCRAVAYDSGVAAARRRLVRLVTEARARGVALDAAMALGGREASDWMAARLEGRSRDPAPDPVMVQMLMGLVERVESIGDRPYSAGALEVPVPATDCGPLPFVVN